MRIRFFGITARVWQFRPRAELSTIVVIGGLSHISKPNTNNCLVYFQFYRRLSMDFTLRISGSCTALVGVAAAYRAMIKGKNRVKLKVSFMNEKNKDNAKIGNVQVRETNKKLACQYENKRRGPSGSGCQYSKKLCACRTKMRIVYA